MELLGSVWLAHGQVLISDYRDYHKVLQVARDLQPGARVRYMPEHMIPRDAELVVSTPVAAENSILNEN